MSLRNAWILSKQCRPWWNTGGGLHWIWFFTVCQRTHFGYFRFPRSLGIITHFLNWKLNYCFSLVLLSHLGLNTHIGVSIKIHYVNIVPHYWAVFLWAKKVKHWPVLAVHLIIILMAYTKSPDIKSFFEHKNKIVFLSTSCGAQWFSW